MQEQSIPPAPEPPVPQADPPQAVTASWQYRARPGLHLTEMKSHRPCPCAASPSAQVTQSVTHHSFLRGIVFTHPPASMDMGQACRSPGPLDTVHFCWGRTGGRAGACGRGPRVAVPGGAAGRGPLPSRRQRQGLACHVIAMLSAGCERPVGVPLGAYVVCTCCWLLGRPL